MGVNIKCLHSNRGGEYMSDAFVTYLDEQGTARKLTVHDTPEENGVAERLNRTLMERVHAMVIVSGMPHKSWGEALMHVCWLKNRTWTCALPPGITPYERVYGEAPALTELPIWGGLVWILDTSNGKLAARAREGRWVGFALESNSHRVYWPERKTVTVECNVVFSREHLPVVLEEDVFETMIVDEARGSEKATEDLINKPNEHHAENEDERETSEVAEGLTDVLDEPPAPAEPVQQPPALIPNPTLPVLCHSARTCNPSCYARDLNSGEFTTGSCSGSVPRGLQVLKNMEIRPEMEGEVGGTAMAAEMGMGSGLEPRNLAEVMCRPDWHHWKDAMDKELSALKAHSTWKLTDLPAGANLVGCRWTFIIKKDAAGNIVRYKVRLIAQGFSQVPGVDFFNTYMPVAKMASI